MSNRITEYPFYYHDEEFIYLYKHVRFSNGSLAILKDGTIRFTPPKEFNDPLDCVYAVSENYFYSADEIKVMFKKRGLGSLSQKESVHLAAQAKIIQSNEMKDLSYFGELNKYIGICCLNHNPLNILMWSHYADHHKGFLIEFKFPKLAMERGIEFIDFLPIPVDYEKAIPIVTKNDRLNPTDISTKAYLTKSKDWEYEKEFRILKCDISNPIQNYPQNKILCSVIAGLKIEEENEKILRKICEAKGISIYKIERNNNSYGLTVPTHPRLKV